MIWQNLLICLLLYRGYGLENGLARTPPMGWMSWTVFLCEMDCNKHPNTCISEQLYMQIADRMAEDGYLEAGYHVVHIDDCWMARKRTSERKLAADQIRFPSGIPTLADYVHQKGLKFGIYADFGYRTCMGFPGSYGHIETDAQTFADWNVDYLKFDGCNIDLNLLPIGYAQMAQALNKTGRPIVYSCSWPAYLVNQPEKVNYTQIGQSCNLWRNFMPDVAADWSIIMKIIDYYTKNQDKLIAANGPGHWHDPDMIVVGDPRLTPDQSRAQMTMWSIWSAPLIMSNDLRNIDPIYKAILLNKRVIAVDQDPLGIMGRLVKKSGSTSIYVKKMTPCDENHETCSYAVAILNRSKRDLVTETFTLTELGLIHHSGYNILELWDGKNMGTFKSEDTYSAKVPPTGVHFFKATPKIFEENAEKVDDFEGKEINEDRDVEKSLEYNNENHFLYYFFILFICLTVIYYLKSRCYKPRMLARIRRKINLF